MSSSARRFFIGFGFAIVLTFILAGVAIIAFNAGRRSAQPIELTRSSIVATVEDGESTPVSDQMDKDQMEVHPSPGETGEEGPGDVAGQMGKEDESAQKEDSPATPFQEGQPDQDEVDPPAAANEAAADGPRMPVELESSDLELFLEVWEIIDEEFDGQLPEETDVTYRAIAGSLELLNDNYTRFITPQIADHMREQLDGSFEGIGAFVDLDPDGYLIIVRPIEDQPADRAGLQEGDLISHVDGESVLGKSLEEITSIIKGPEGTQVTLTVLRTSLDEPFDVTVTRERIEIPIVSGEILEEDVAYVRLSGFSANAAQQLESQLQELLDQEPQGLILDLRDNPGGFLSQSVEVADLFLDEGVILYERDGRDLEEVFESEGGDLAEEVELVILVNAGSASASEIVAGAVQDRERGTLIGETSFGKGSVQQTHTLSDGSELRVTIARWYTPDNRSIDVDGITPDIHVPTPQEFGGEADTQLQRAIELILDGRQGT